MCFVFFYYVRLCSYFSKLLNQLLLRCYKKFSETTQKELKILGLLVKNFAFSKTEVLLYVFSKDFRSSQARFSKKWVLWDFGKTSINNVWWSPLELKLQAECFSQIYEAPLLLIFSQWCFCIFIIYFYYFSLRYFTKKQLLEVRTSFLK